MSVGKTGMMAKTHLWFLSFLLIGQAAAYSGASNWVIYGRLYGLRYQEGGCAGGNLRHLTGTNATVDYCSKQCRRDGLCAGFVYEESTVESCWLKMTPCRGNMERNSTTENGTKLHEFSKDRFSVEYQVSTWARQGKYSLYASYNCLRGKETPEGEERTLLECRADCEEVGEECIGFVWSVDKNVCYIKTDRCTKYATREWMIYFERGDEYQQVARKTGWKYENHDCVGGTREVVDNITVSQCLEICRVNNTCRLIVYNSEVDTCLIKIADCEQVENYEAHTFIKPWVMQSSLGDTSRFSRWTFNPQLKKKDYVFSQGMCENGELPNTTENVTRARRTLKECREMCDNEAGCSLYAWTPAEEDCHLGNEICLNSSTAVVKEGRVVFIKEANYSTALAEEKGYRFLGGGECEQRGKTINYVNLTLCFDHCDQNPWCAGFSYNVNKRECVLGVGGCQQKEKQFEWMDYTTVFSRNEVLTAVERYRSWAEENDYEYTQGTCNHYERPFSGKYTLEYCSRTCLQRKSSCLAFSWDNVTNQCVAFKRRCGPMWFSRNRTGNFFRLKNQYKPFAEEKGYGYIWGKCLGPNLKDFGSQRMNKQSCYEKCKYDPICSGFVYSVGSPSCYLKIGSCPNVTEKEGYWHSFIKPNPLQEPSRYQLFGLIRGYNLTAGACDSRTSDITYPKLATFEGCATRCSSSKTCRQFVFSSNLTDGTDKCILKTTSCYRSAPKANQTTLVYEKDFVNFNRKRGKCTIRRGETIGSQRRGKSISECAHACQRSYSCKSFIYYGTFALDADPYCQLTSRKCSYYYITSNSNFITFYKS